MLPWHTRRLHARRSRPLAACRRCRLPTLPLADVAACRRCRLPTLPLADVADREQCDRGPELVIGRKDAVRAMPVLLRWRDEIREPVEELKRREFDDAVGPRPR
jgi:hypothetical protein